jgi:hypothetical protein
VFKYSRNGHRRYSVRDVVDHAAFLKACPPRTMAGEIYRLTWGWLTISRAWVSFFCGARTEHAGLTPVKTACFRLLLRARAIDYARRFHGVTDGPLFRAAAKKDTHALGHGLLSPFCISLCRCHGRQTPHIEPLRKQVVFFFEISPGTIPGGQAFRKPP